MNFAGMCASLYVGLDCLGKGAGTVPQFMFADGSSWLWYVIGSIWIFAAVVFALRGLATVLNS